MTSPSPELAGRRMMGMNFAPNVRPIHVFSFLSMAWAGIMLSSFIAASQAYLFTEFMGIDLGSHGTLAGDLAFWGEIIFIALAGLWGALSDKNGRRRVMAVGIFLMGVGVMLYAYTTSYVTLYLGRMVFAAGGSAFSVMIVALIADYAEEDSRGRLTGYQGMCNGLGAMMAVLLFVKIPDIAQSFGYGPVEAGRIMYFVVFGCAMIITVIAWFGLLKQEAKHQDTSIPMRETLREGFIAGKQPRILLSYGAAFLSRANIAIVGTFFILWVTNHGTSIGLDRAEAFARGGMIIGIAQFFALLFAPVFGILSDRIDRVQALMVSLVFSAIGYGGAYFVTDPFGVSMIICAALIGIGEVGTIITSATLIAQEAPKKVRGAVIGFFTLCGAFGIMSAAKIGGYTFDTIAPSAPFVLFGIVALIILIWAAIVQMTHPRRAEAPA